MFAKIYDPLIELKLLTKIKNALHVPNKGIYKIGHSPKIKERSSMFHNVHKNKTCYQDENRSSIRYLFDGQNKNPAKQKVLR